MGVAALAVLLAACASDAPQDALDPAGPTARQINDLFTPIFWIAVAIFVIVEGGILWFVWRYRHRKDRPIPAQIHGNTRLEIAWTIAPALLLAVIAVPTVTTIWDLAREPDDPSTITVDVVGHQWWWQFDYPDLGITTANQLHIPVDTPIYVRLHSSGTVTGALGAEVLHSFWVPRLAGKQDVVPGRTNTLVLQADEPGTYPGQCAEFCGLSHAYMRFEVVAQTQAEFDAWVSDQQAEAQEPTEALAKQGQELFLQPQLCAACHAVSGTSAQAKGGPDLTHFAGRSCFAGCWLESTPENLRAWLEDPPAIKPGSVMPSYNLSQEEIDALIAYLQTLE